MSKVKLSIKLLNENEEIDEYSILKYKYKGFISFLKNYKKRNEFYEILFFALGILSTGILGSVIEIASIVYCLCFFNSKIPYFNYIIMYLFTIMLVLENISYISSRAIPIGDIVYMISFNKDINNIKPIQIVSITFSLVSFINPLFISNIAISSKYIVKANLYIFIFTEKIRDYRYNFEKTMGYKKNI